MGIPAQAKKIDQFEYCGVNHVALTARDMAETVKFYTEVLEMKLIKTLDLPHGRGQHFFFDIGNGDTLAFFWFPNAPKAMPGFASQNLDVPRDGNKTAHGSMNHLAIGVPLEKFEATVARLNQKGVPNYILNHEDSDRHGSTEINEKTWVCSVYFYDCNGIQLEFAAFTRAFHDGDVAHDPVNAEGVKVKGIVKRKVAEPAE
jgi:catechol 2,3-dioxygenase-like lactoylglutathione lyase family enzyme